jgi:FAD/FMN-containing dehydrogenase
MVIADGTRLIVSETENADLFWGVRGGGSNFGIVTEFVLKLHPQQETVFSGMLAFPPSALENVMTEVIKRNQTGILEKEAYMVIATNLPDPAKMVSVWACRLHGKQP